MSTHSRTPALILGSAAVVCSSANVSRTRMIGALGLLSLPQWDNNALGRREVGWARSSANLANHQWR